MTALATFDSRVSFGGFYMNGELKTGRFEFVGPVADYFWIGIMALAQLVILPIAGLGYAIETSGDLTASVSFAWRVAGVIVVALWWGVVWSNVRSHRKKER